MGNEVLFQEVQYFESWVISILLFVGVVIPVVLLFMLRTRHKKGERIVLIINSAVCFFLAAGIFLLFGKMTTRVTAQEVRVMFGYPPAYQRIVPLWQIRGAEATSYKYTDYGGWGIRARSFHETAITQQGNRAVQLNLLSEDILLVGSQKPEEFAQALRPLLAARAARQESLKTITPDTKEPSR